MTATTLAFPHPEVEILTQPKPGDEYVFVQTTSLGARPIARKDKHQTEERSFETSHKLPPSLTYILNQNNAEEEQYKLEQKSKPQKRQIRSAKAQAPAPAGAIKLDVRKLLEKYKTELKTSTTKAPTTTKNSKRTPSKRIKKDIAEITSPSPILTTAAAIAKQKDDGDDDIPLLASSSEKQRSRIQIKKAPNGQEYEYEYVYYYYDDDEEDAKVTNSHDGPARSPAKAASKNREVIERTSATPEANEILPVSKNRNKGRQLGEEVVNEERLPANTRFPPRSRNINTTPIPEEEPKTSRGRNRGRPTTEAAPENDNVSDETQVTNFQCLEK